MELKNKANRFIEPTLYSTSNFLLQVYYRIKYIRYPLEVVVVGSLLEQTLMLMKHRKMTLPELAIASNLPFYWLRKFASNEIKDPSVNKVQTLYEYLSGKKIIPE